MPKRRRRRGRRGPRPRYLCGPGKPRQPCGPGRCQGADPLRQSALAHAWALRPGCRRARCRNSPASSSPRVSPRGAPACGQPLSDHTVVALLGLLGAPPATPHLPALEHHERTISASALLLASQSRQFRCCSGHGSLPSVERTHGYVFPWGLRPRRHLAGKRNRRFQPDL